MSGVESAWQTAIRGSTASTGDANVTGLNTAALVVIAASHLIQTYHQPQQAIAYRNACKSFI
jgi:hypothetical protein